MKEIKKLPTRRRTSILQVIDKLSDREMTDRLELARLALNSRTEVGRLYAIRKLGGVVDKLLIDTVKKALGDRGALVRMEAFEIIILHELKGFQKLAVNGLADKNVLVQARAAWLLGEIRTKSAMDAIERNLPRLRNQARISAEASLYEMDLCKSRLETIISFLLHSDTSVRRNAANTLTYIATKENGDSIIQALRVASKNEKIPGVTHDLKKCIKEIEYLLGK